MKTQAAGPRRLRALPWVGLALAVVTFYWVEATLRKTPWVFMDELEWSQISRAIAATGHAARRGEPIGFKSVYAYLIAPAWWIHSTAAAYAAIKYLNAVVMCLAAVPAYLLSRLLVARRAAVAVAVLTIAIPSMSYATSIVPEPLAYPWFALTAWLAVRALAAPDRVSVALALGSAALGPAIRTELIVLPVSLLLAAALLWALHGGDGLMGRRLVRALVAAVVLAVCGFVFNQVVVERFQTWHPSEFLNRRTFEQGGLAAGALAIGLGLLPVIGGLVSLYLPERRGDPRYRAFAAYLAASIATVWVYTAAKSSYLASSYTSLIEERNLFYLAPLLLVGTALALTARRIDWRLVAAATALVLVTVWSGRFEVGMPYFEAPGLAVLTLVNRDLRWDVNDFHRLLVSAAVVSVALLALRHRRGVAVAAATLTCSWLLTGEIYATIGNIDEANVFAKTLPAPRSWLDADTHGAPATFIGQRITDPNPLWLVEFWNRSLHHVASLDGSAPGPGPTTAPGLESIDGALSGWTGDRYVLAGDGVNLAAPVVDRRDGFSLYRTPGPWHLLDEEQNVYGDGWASSPFAYTYFAPGGPGTLVIDLSRTGYRGDTPPGRGTITVGTVKLDQNGVPELRRVLGVRRVTVPNGHEVVVRVHVASTPVTVSIAMTTFSTPTDPRHLAAQPAFRFVRDA